VFQGKGRCVTLAVNIQTSLYCQLLYSGVIYPPYRPSVYSSQCLNSNFCMCVCFYFNNSILQLNILSVPLYILRKAYNFATGFCNLQGPEIDTQWGWDFPHPLKLVQGMALMTHFYLVLRLSISTAIPLLPLEFHRPTVTWPLCPLVDLWFIIGTTT
jgi:hypothetical protein